MAAEYGFVYVLANESMPGIYKIGFTAGHPAIRIAQLSSATSCPTPFTMLAAFGCENPSEVESEIHEELAEFRVNRSREFFKARLSVIRDAIRPHSDPFFDLASFCQLECDLGTEEDRLDDLWKVNHFLSQSADPIYWPQKFGGFK